MPRLNKFRHQQYPTVPAIKPQRRKVTVRDGDGTDFSQLHADHGIHHVLLVHGTFLGDDPVGIGDILRGIGKRAGFLGKSFAEAADKLAEATRATSTSFAQDVANYCEPFRKKFATLVDGDPVVLMEPRWSSQNHHIARADLAIRLFLALHRLVQSDDQRVLLWGHSHAGNGFAILTNLLANDRASVESFFDAAGPQGDHWQQAKSLLSNAPTPHPLAKSTDIAAFGTPVRYGWDTTGYRSLVHVLHHREPESPAAHQTKPLFPPHNIKDTVTAKYGDWVQTFAIAGTDVATSTSLRCHKRLESLLTANLAEPDHDADTRFIVPSNLKDACARWKTGTRCHADGLNLLIDYDPCGRTTTIGQPIERSVLGHGVATTIDWLPTHLSLVLNALSD